MTGKDEASSAVPGPANVDYSSKEFLVGFEDGKAGRPGTTKHEVGTQDYFNYVEGWLMGDAEKGDTGEYASAGKR